MSTAAPVAIGDVVDGKYRIEKKLGSGAMGVVYAAQHLQLDERVALKFLSPSLRASPDAKARFQREAKATFSLRSEHIARVLDVGKLPSDTPFIVMEYLEGETLKTRVAERGLPAVDEAITLALEACEGVAEAHARGIVHRDLKPENLFLTKRGDGRPILKVLDFGISKAVLTPAEPITGSHDLVGTPRYMAPEQFGRPSGIDARVDVWALGVILYFLLTGKTPFDGATQLGIMQAILEGVPARPSSQNPLVSAQLEAVLLKCLARDKGARFTNASELARALEQARLEGGATTTDVSDVTVPNRARVEDALEEDTEDTEPEQRSVSSAPVKMKTAAQKSAADDDTVVTEGKARDVDEPTQPMRKVRRPPSSRPLGGTPEQELASVIVSEQARASIIVAPDVPSARLPPAANSEPTMVGRRRVENDEEIDPRPVDVRRNDFIVAVALGFLVAVAVFLVIMRLMRVF